MRKITAIKCGLALAGLTLLISAFAFFKNTQLLVKESQITEGVVVDLINSQQMDNSTVFQPVVEFKNSHGWLITFSPPIANNPPTYYVGDTVDVIYKVPSPEIAQISSFYSRWGYVIIFGISGLLLFAGSLSCIYCQFRQCRNNDYLKEKGLQIQAKFHSIEVNKAIEVYGRNPFQICAKWRHPITSKFYIFNSENIWFDPTGYIGKKPINVLIDKKNPEKYIVDISDLPKIGG